jgi:hypothetical protein
MYFIVVVLHCIVSQTSAVCTYVHTSTEISGGLILCDTAGVVCHCLLAQQNPSPETVDDHSWQLLVQAEAAVPAMKGLCADIERNWTQVTVTFVTVAFVTVTFVTATIA